MNDTLKNVRRYPALFTTDPEVGGYMVTFRDLPEAYTQGDDETDAMSMGEEILGLVLEDYVLDGRPIPEPSAAEPGERLISVVVPEVRATRTSGKA